MKNFKKLREEALRQQQRHEHVLNEGDIVMDTFLGGGTTAIAWKNKNR